MKYITVFCSASDVAEKYVSAAKEFSSLLAHRGYGLVWGGSDQGIMKIVADEVEMNGGKLIGISVEFLQNVVRAKADEMVIAKDLSERKAKLLERGDVIVVLPGGVGTLDEVAEILEHKKQGHHTKQVIILNTDHFYDHLKLQLEHMAREGFINKEINDLAVFVSTPHEIFEHISTA